MAKAKGKTRGIKGKEKGVTKARAKERARAEEKGKAERTINHHRLDARRVLVTRIGIPEVVQRARIANTSM